MKTKLFAIAKITKASGLKGAVGIKPLIRQFDEYVDKDLFCLLYTSPSPRDATLSRMPSSA